MKLRSLIKESSVISKLENAETAIKYACKDVSRESAGKFNQLKEYQDFVDSYEKLIKSINLLKQKIKGI